MADYERPILAAEEKFFNECNTGNGKFIVIAIAIVLILIWLMGSACDCCVDQGWYINPACFPANEKRGLRNMWRNNTKGCRCCIPAAEQPEGENWKPAEGYQSPSKSLSVIGQWVMKDMIPCCSNVNYIQGWIKRVLIALHCWDAQQLHLVTQLNYKNCWYPLSRPTLSWTWNMQWKGKGRVHYIFIKSLINWIGYLHLYRKLRDLKREN